MTPRASAPPVPPPVNLSSLVDGAKCHELVRRHRRPGGVRCPARDSAAVARHGGDDARPGRQRYRREAGGGRLDEVTDTGLAGHHRPLRGRVSRL
jgi:hypothetical protein